MLVPLDRYPLHVNPRRRGVLVPKRILCLDDATCRLAHPPGERVARLVEVNVTVTCLARIIWHKYGQAINPWP